MTSEAYARQLKQLLPRGMLWRLDPDSGISLLLLAIADELARVDARGEVLVDEMDPSTAVETLEDWERVLALPEPGQALPAAVTDRQVAAAAKYTARGGQSEAYFIALAASLGFPGVTITYPAAYTWRLNVDLALAAVAYTLTATTFRAGDRAGSYITARTVAELEAAVRRAKPAHTIVQFAYSPYP